MVRGPTGGWQETRSQRTEKLGSASIVSGRSTAVPQFTIMRAWRRRAATRRAKPEAALAFYWLKWPAAISASAPRAVRDPRAKSVVLAARKHAGSGCGGFSGPARGWGAEGHCRCPGPARGPTKSSILLVGRLTATAAEFDFVGWSNPASRMGYLLPPGDCIHHARTEDCRHRRGRADRGSAVGRNRRVAARESQRLPRRHP